MSVTRSKQRNQGAYDGNQRGKLPVYNSGIESGNLVLSMDHPMRELFIANDSEVDNMEITVSGDADLSLQFAIKPGETFDERLPEFLTVTVLASGDWRWIVRSGRVA